MDPKDQSKAERATTWIANNFPGLWRKMYLNLIEEGFTEVQAFTILLTYITAACKSNS